MDGTCPSPTPLRHQAYLIELSLEEGRPKKWYKHNADPFPALPSQEFVPYSSRAESLLPKKGGKRSSSWWRDYLGKKDRHNLSHETGTVTYVFWSRAGAKVAPLATPRSRSHSGAVCKANLSLVPIHQSRGQSDA